jgi:hypothetical protein
MNAAREPGSVENSPILMDFPPSVPLGFFRFLRLLAPLFGSPPATSAAPKCKAEPVHLTIL